MTRHQIYHQKNKAKCNLKNREYYAKNKDHQNTRRRANYRANKQRDLIRGNKRVKERLRTDGAFRMCWNIRCRMRFESGGQSVKGLLGCSLQFLKGYMEGQFQKGMTWSNYGSEWEVDHVMPCASFDLSLPVDQKRCFHYTNLQPLWASQNREKHNTVPVCHQPRLL